MRKTDKKRDNDIIRALTEVCEQAKNEHPGFAWLTHEANHQKLVATLQVTLVFDEHISDTQLHTGLQALVPRVQQALAPIIGVTLPARQIHGRREHALH